jgi:predicted outer membrane repeat protein
MSLYNRGSDARTRGGSWEDGRPQPTRSLQINAATGVDSQWCGLRSLFPCATLGYAIAELTTNGPFLVYNVAAGTYATSSVELLYPSVVIQAASDSSSSPLFNGTGTILSLSASYFQLSGIQISGDTTLSIGSLLHDVIITSCQFTGTVQVKESAVTIFTSCTFSNSTSTTDGGALFMTYATSSLTNCKFIGNQAVGGSGGAINSVSSSITLDSCTFTENTALQNGGAIVLSRGTISIHGGSFTSNTADIGGVIWLDSVTSATITGPVFTSNVAQEGAALYIRATTTTIESITASSNVAIGTAGGFGGVLSMSDSTIIVKNSQFTSNSIQQSGDSIVTGGGAVFGCRQTTSFTSSILRLINVTAIDNTANVGVGGVLHSLKCTIDIQSSNLTGNSAPLGGAIFAKDGSGNVSSSQLCANKATGNGGVFYLFNSLWLTSFTTYCNNIAAGGGAVFFADKAAPTYTSCIFTSNTASYTNDAEIAGSPTILNLITEPTGNQTSGAALSPLFKFSLLDVSGHVVNTAINTQVQAFISSEELTAGVLLSGRVFVSPISGIVTFGSGDGTKNIDLALLGPASTYNVTFTTSTTLYDSSVISMSITRPVTLRNCVAGEFYASKQCQDCQAGTFTSSLNVPDSCQSCPVGSFSNTTRATSWFVCHCLSAPGFDQSFTTLLFHLS